jgi:hypothetical protein
MDSMDEQRDPAAELARTFQAFADAFGRAAAAWFEQQRPFFEACAKIAEDPAVRAYIEARKRGEIPAPEPRRPCHCFCGYTHPRERVCDGEAVTTRRYGTDRFGAVDVALCAPCAVAQGVAELEGSRDG